MREIATCRVRDARYLRNIPWNDRRPHPVLWFRRLVKTKACSANSTAWLSHRPRYVHSAQPRICKESPCLGFVRSSRRRPAMGQRGGAGPCRAIGNTGPSLSYDAWRWFQWRNMWKAEHLWWAALVSVARGAHHCGTIQPSRRPGVGHAKGIENISRWLARRISWSRPPVRRSIAAIEPAILLRRPGLLITPCLEVCLFTVWQEHVPCRVEVGAGLVESLCRAARAFAGTWARIEPTLPFPWFGVVWIAGALRDRAGVDVAVIDQPALWSGDRRRVSVGMSDNRAVKSKSEAAGYWGFAACTQGARCGHWMHLDRGRTSVLRA